MKRKHKKELRRSTRTTRQSRIAANESFRRNVVVFSREQKELARHQQSVTQRQIERKLQHTKRRMRQYAIAAFFGVIMVMLAIRMVPTNITLSSNASTKLSSQQQSQYITAWMQQYKKLAPLGQYWLLDDAELEKAILQEYPEVEDITISASVPFSTKLEINVRFRRAVFTWRDATGDLQYVDRKGVLFSRDYDASVDAKKLITIEDQSGTVLDPGNSVLTTELVKFVGLLHDQIKAVYPGKAIAKVIIPISTREVQIQVTDMPYIIKFSSERELAEQVNELGLLVNHLSAQQVQPTSYIDIRIPHKAFYK